MAEQLDEIVKGYRYNESQPHGFGTKQVSTLAKAAQYAVDNLGVPAVAISSLPARILMEGRADAGVNDNSWNKNNKSAQQVYDGMIDAGFKPSQATYAAAVTDKSQVANRLGITFDEAWNGTGRSQDSGKTGKDYSNSMAQSSSAVMTDPRNADFVNFINRSANNQLTPKEKLAQLTPNQVIDRIFGTAGPNDLMGLDSKEDTFVAALFDSAQKAGADTNIDTAKTVLKYRDTAASTAVNVAKQKLGIPLTEYNGDKSNTAKVNSDPVLKTIFDALSDPIVKQYQGN